MPKNTAADPAHTNLSAAIRELAPTAVLSRIYPERRSVTHLFEEGFYRILIDRRTEQRIAYMVRRNFRNAADWRRAHDFYIPTGTLYFTPESDQHGHIPEDDHSFGLALTRRIAIADGSYR